MTDRDRLIELLKKDNCPSPFLCDEKCKYANLKRCYEVRTADHLIANGIIVPPCKVGDYVYCIFENKVCLASVIAFYIDKVGIIVELRISLNDERPTAPCAVCHIDRDSYSDNDIYLTREEAEKALERSEGNA